MQDAIYVVGPNRQLITMRPTDYPSEAEFQGLLTDHPGLLAGEQMDPDDPRRFILVAQEIGVPDGAAAGNRWALDHLFIDQNGIPTFVEVKRRSDARLRREVVGQMLDYAANAVAYWTAGSLAAAFEATCAKRGRSPPDALEEFLGRSATEGFWEQAYARLQAGDVRLVFVADHIPTELQRVIEFLNERMSPTEVLGLELRRFTGDGFSTHLPRVIGRTAEAAYRKEAGRAGGAARKRWDEESFRLEIARAVGEQAAQQLGRLLERCVAMFPKINWGTGTARGSFSPIEPDISQRGPITIYSDGELHIKVSWLNDTARAKAWRALLEPELQRVGLIRDPAKENVHLPLATWLPLVGELERILAIRPA